MCFNPSSPECGSVKTTNLKTKTHNFQALIFPPAKTAGMNLWVAGRAEHKNYCSNWSWIFWHSRTLSVPTMDAIFFLMLYRSFIKSKLWLKKQKKTDSSIISFEFTRLWLKEKKEEKKRFAIMKFHWFFFNKSI